MVDILLEEFIDFEILGIISNLNNTYQFVYHLNTTYGTNFARDNDLDIIIQEEIVYYPNFCWEDIDNQVEYNLIKNMPFQSLKTQKLSMYEMFDVSPLLIPQYKNYNFILKISGWEFGIEHLNLPFGLDAVIQSITPFNVEQIKTVERLIF
ncbi:IPExxxVDY family protein [Vaginella massiliensis]|uniref:IPExxxVDY family protein n=1 Tax=Vaginella massiliensis TaxID=1816680 RepID=UPI0008398FA9|nr:IPExxxVDY family protein [Vaginella massiliensis]